MNGTSAGVGEAFSPLVGIWAPTFSACELAAAFLLPFVAIRLVSGDRQSGALKLELQHPMPAFARVGAKALVLLAGWLIAFAAPLAAILLWKSYGGSIYPPELATVAIGHVLNAGLTIALAAAMASLTEHPSTAAILTLSVTVGTWIINFIAAVNGGVWERAAGYTPTAMVAEFQHGLVRLDVTLVALALIAAGLTFAAIWMRLGITVRRRAYESIAVGAVAAAAIFACAFVNTSWDTSESRSNSFSEPDEDALRQIRLPLRIEAHLAPEDPRRFDLEHRALVQAPARHAEGAGRLRVGHVHRALRTDERALRRDLVRPRRPQDDEPVDDGGRRPRDDLRARRRPPPIEKDDVFRGHPLAVPPKGAATVFYGIWPAAIVAGLFFVRRRRA